MMDGGSGMLRNPLPSPRNPRLLFGVLLAQVNEHQEYVVAHVLADMAIDRPFFDGIVDFMVYPHPEFEEYMPLFLEHTDHYIFLSS